MPGSSCVRDANKLKQSGGWKEFVIVPCCLLLSVQLLQARLNDAELVMWHCRALEAYARCVSSFPDLMPVIMQKVSSCYAMLGVHSFIGDLIARLELAMGWLELMVTLR